MQINNSNKNLSFTALKIDEKSVEKLGLKTGKALKEAIPKLKKLYQNERCFR